MRKEGVGGGWGSVGGGWGRSVGEGGGDALAQASQLLIHRLHETFGICAKRSFLSEPIDGLRVLRQDRLEQLLFAHHVSGCFRRRGRCTNTGLIRIEITKVMVRARLWKSLARGCWCRRIP